MNFIKYNFLKCKWRKGLIIVTQRYEIFPFWCLTIHLNTHNRFKTIFTIPSLQSLYLRSLSTVTYILNRALSKIVASCSAIKFCVLNSIFTKLLYWSVNQGLVELSHFSPVFHFYTPWKRHKIKGFLMISGGIEMEHWSKMG